MGGGSGGGQSTSTTTATIAPELRPLFSSTANIIEGAQTGEDPGILGPFLQSNPQQIPQATAGQQAILGRQQQRAGLGGGGGQVGKGGGGAGTGGGSSLVTPGDRQANQLAQGFGQLRGPEQQALGLASGFGNITGAEQTGLGIAGGFGNLRAAEQAGLGFAGQQGSGGFNFAEQAALGQINRFTGGEIGQSPATQAALAAIRAPIQNDLALAGLGNSGEVGSALAAASAPILAQELQARASVIPQLAGLGQTIRGGQQFASQAFQRAGEAQRAGDVQTAGMFQRAGEAQRADNVQAAQMFQRAGEAQRVGDIQSAQFLSAQAEQLVQRESTLLSELGTSEEANRALAAQQAEAQQRDFQRQQALISSLTTGILGGFPSSLGSTTTGSQSGGK